MDHVQNRCELKVTDIPGLLEIGLEKLRALGRGEYALVPVTRTPIRLPVHESLTVTQCGCTHLEMLRKIDSRFSLSSWAIDFLRADVYESVCQEQKTVHIIRIEHLGRDLTTLHGLIAHAKTLGYTLVNTELLCELRLALTIRVFEVQQIRTLIIPVQPQNEYLRAPFFTIQKNADIRNFGASYFGIEEYDHADCAIAFLAPT